MKLMENFYGKKKRGGELTSIILGVFFFEEKGGKGK